MSILHLILYEVDQYEVERAALRLSDSNLNVPCESGICYPSMLVMHHRRQTQSKISVILYIHVYTMYIHVLYNVHTCTYMFIQCTYMYVHVYQFNMLCLAGQHTFFNWLCTP